jgi:hypothetical protein
MKASRSKFTPPPALVSASVVAELWCGVHPFGLDGKPLTLAIINDAGEVIEAGEVVTREVWWAALNSYWEHLRELGIMVEPEEPTTKNGRPAPAVHQ